jgi:hypothetical protein
MRGAILPLPQYVFMAWCLVKHRNNFTFYSYIHKSISVCKKHMSIINHTPACISVEFLLILRYKFIVDIELKYYTA